MFQDSADSAFAHTYRGQPLEQRLLGGSSLLDRFWQHAAATPGRPCLTELRAGRVGETFTYGELARAVCSAGAALPEATRLGVVLRNDCASVVQLLAVLAGGATAVVLSPQAPDARRAEQAAAAGCEVLQAPAAMRRILAADRVGPLPRGPASLDDPALIIFTSGSTASSKAVVQTHYNVLVNLSATIRHHRLDGRTRLLCCLPLHHVNGLHFTILSTLLAGAHVLLCDGFEPAHYLSYVRDQAVDIGSVVPAILEVLREARRAPELPRLRYLVSAAAPLHAVTARGVHERLGVRVLQGYGLTETMNFSTTMPIGLSAHSYERLMHSSEIPPIGEALWGNELAVLDEAGEELPEGTEGELCVRGHNVMHGYLGNAAASRQAFAGGWFHTGDLARVDGETLPDRRLYRITGRIKNIVKVAGEAVSLDELDRVLMGVEGVKDAVSFGVPDAVLGEVPIVLVSGEHAHETALWAALAEKMPATHRPRELIRVQAVPYMPNGKVNRAELRRSYEAGCWSTTP